MSALQWDRVDANTYEAPSNWQHDGIRFRYRLVCRRMSLKGRVLSKWWRVEHDAEIRGSGPQGPWVNLSSAKRAVQKWHDEVEATWARAMGNMPVLPADEE